MTLNRPDLGNAIDQELADALLSAAIACRGRREARTIAAVSAGPEAREGVAAFLEKRAARFKAEARFGPPQLARWQVRAAVLSVKKAVDVL